jgi:SAM-dependent methyltransferase
MGRPTRGMSFGSVAEAYARHRPGYPDPALRWVLSALGATNERAPLDVLDLAAGTGKLTQSLVRLATEQRIVTVTAVEPDQKMLDVLRDQLASAEMPVTALIGSAERIPLPDSSVHAVLVGQAFHWFDQQRAIAEIGRVLRPGGVLAALWNAEDHSADWVAGYHEAASADRYVPGVPRGSDRPDLPGNAAFTPTERAEFRHSRRLTVNRLIALLETHSWALLSTPRERAEIFERIRSYLVSRPEVGVSDADAEFDLPLRTTVLRALRR